MPTEKPSAWLHAYRLPLVLGLALAAWFLMAWLQPVIDYAANPLFDGNQYARLYTSFEGGEAQAPDFPFHSRVLVPWLASMIPADMLLSFGLLNLCFVLLGIVVLDRLWQAMELPAVLIYIAHGWWLLHWSGALKINLFDPITVDLPIYALQGLLLLFLLRKQGWHLLWLAPLATTQKESFIALLLIALLLSVYYQVRGLEGALSWKWIAGALVLALCGKYAINYFFPPLEEGGSSLRTLLYHAKITLQNPFDLLRWLAAIVSAGGAFLILSAERWQLFKERDYLRDFLLLGTLCYWAFGILAGRDMLRIIFLGMPFWLTLCLWLMRKQPVQTVLLSLILSVPFMKLRGFLPDPSLEPRAWADWYPSRATPIMIGAWLAYFAICGLVLRFREKWLG